MRAEDVEVVMKDGLGFRYAWLGPLETALLNADGNLDTVFLKIYLLVLFT